MIFAKVKSVSKGFEATKLLELGASAGVVSAPAILLLGLLERRYRKHPDRGME